MKRYAVVFEESAQADVRNSYRVLFTISGRKVHVLHIRGAYVDSVDR